MAAAVSKEEIYILLHVAGESLLVAEKLADAFLSETGIVASKGARIPGEKLVGLEYNHCLESHMPENRHSARTIISTDFVDMSTGTLFIHRLPVELQVQIIKLMVERVTIGKDNITVKLYELSVAALRKSLDKKGVCFGGYRQGERQGPNATGNAKTAKSPQSGTGTAVVELEAKWRERHPPNATHENPKTVLSLWENRWIPELNLTFDAVLNPITNGERIIREAADSPQNPDFPGSDQKFISRRLRERRDCHHLTQTGVPVRVLHRENNLMAVHSLATDNRFTLPQGYQLLPFKATGAACGARQSPYMGPRAKLRHDPAPPKPLAPIIDALLLKGGLTIQGLAREAKRRASAACKGKDLKANIRARLYWFKRKGCRIKKNKYSQLKVCSVPFGA